MEGWRPHERLGRFRSPEPQVRIVLPRKANAAVELDSFERGLDISLACHKLRKARC